MIAWLQLITRILLAGIFLYAGVIKFLNPDSFLMDIESYRMMPYTAAWLVAFYLPPLEMLCGGALLVPRLRIASSIILSLLMLVFIVAIGFAWTRGLDISCGCFGATKSETNYSWLIIRDLIITAALVFNLFKPSNTYDEI